MALQITNNAKQCNKLRLGPESVEDSKDWGAGPKTCFFPCFIEQVLDCLLVERSRIKAQAVPRIPTGLTSELKRN